MSRSALIRPRCLPTMAGTSGLTPSTAIVRMILEKRASVLEGALHRNPGSVALRTAHLQLAEQLQEHDAVDSLWRKALVK